MFHFLKNTRLYFFLAAILWSCSQEPKVNKIVTYEISGICEKCPAERLDSILQNREGILKINIDSQKHILEIGFDSTIVKEKNIIEVLNDHGYDVGLNIAVLVSHKSPCCEQDENNGNFSQDSTNMNSENATATQGNTAKKYTSEDLEDLLNEEVETPEEKMGKDISRLEQKIDTEVEEDIEENIDLADKEMEKLAKEIEEAENAVKEEVKLDDIDADKEIEEYLRKWRQKQKKKR